MEAGALKTQETHAKCLPSILARLIMFLSTAQPCETRLLRETKFSFLIVGTSIKC